jgi:hypothetical protein
MSDEVPFSLPPAPLMTPENARDIARDYKAWAAHLTEYGLTREPAVAMRDSQRWDSCDSARADTKGAMRPSASW